MSEVNFISTKKNNPLKTVPDSGPWVSIVDRLHFEECDLGEGAGTFLMAQQETSEAFGEALHLHGVEQSKMIWCCGL